MDTAASRGTAKKPWASPRAKHAVFARCRIFGLEDLNRERFGLADKAGHVIDHDRLSGDAIAHFQP